jgi:aspartate racemase
MATKREQVEAAAVGGDELALGVLGGMGPEATADFLSKLVAATPVGREQDHLRVFVDSNPKVPDRHRAIRGTGDPAGPALAAMAAGLEAVGADFIVMACNTAHAFEADIRDAIKVPFVSMIAEAVEGCGLAHPGARCIGLLAADGCLEANLYQDAFTSRGREVALLDVDSQTRLMGLLLRIKHGDLGDDVASQLRALGESLIADGAELIVAACTEVPLVLRDGDLTRPIFDPTLHLARRCVRYARRLEPIPEESFASLIHR